jgi:hypothetical protein
MKMKKPPCLKIEDKLNILVNGRQPPTLATFYQHKKQKINAQLQSINLD